MTELEQRLIETLRGLINGLTKRLDAQETQVRSLLSHINKQNEHIEDLAGRIDSLTQLLK